MSVTNQRGVRPEKTSSLLRFSKIFGLIVVAEVLAVIFADQFPALEFLTKPLIMLSLLIFYTLHHLARRRLPAYLMQFSMVFSLMGDIWLSMEGAPYFLLGLGSFLLAQMCYCIVFTLSTWAGPEQPLLRRKPWLVLPYLAYLGGLLAVLFPGLGAMQVPVIIYACMIVGMALTALNRWRQVPDESFARVFMGAMLFVLSDSLIALNTFAQAVLPLPMPRLWIMLTYMAAQFLIVTGMLQQDWRLRPQATGLN
jgi:uncharacterized membrane protein YhhN